MIEGLGSLTLVDQLIDLKPLFTEPDPTRETQHV